MSKGPSTNGKLENLYDTNPINNVNSGFPKRKQLRKYSDD